MCVKQYCSCCKLDKGFATQLCFDECVLFEPSAFLITYDNYILCKKCTRECAWNSNLDRLIAAKKKYNKEYTSLHKRYYDDNTNKLYNVLPNKTLELIRSY